MQSAIQNMTITALICCVVTFSILGTLRGCESARTAYYEAQKNCLAAGGSWVPRGGEGFSADCLRLK